MCLLMMANGSNEEPAMDSERRVRKFVMRLVDGEGKELERRQEEPICSQSADEDFLVQDAFWQLDGIRRQLLGDANTLEEAAEVLKYRVTGPEWQDVTDEELQRYEQQQQQRLERHRMQQEQERSRQQAYKKRNSWWRTLLRSHVVFWDHATCVVHAVGLPGTRYCLRVRDLLLLGAIKAGAQLVRRHKHAQDTKPPRTH